MLIEGVFNTNFPEHSRITTGVRSISNGYVPCQEIEIKEYYSTQAKYKVTQSFPILITFKPLIMSNKVNIVKKNRNEA